MINNHMHRISVYSAQNTAELSGKKYWDWIRTVSHTDIRVLVHGGRGILDDLKRKTGHGGF